jgi:hypothetical protein
MPYNPGMETTGVKCPRRFQFGLRSLFVLITLCGVLLGWQLHLVESRKELLKWIEDAQGSYGIDDFAKPVQVSWLRRLFGDHEITSIELLDSTDTTQLDRIISAFPEAQVRLWHEMPAGGFF